MGTDPHGYEPDPCERLLRREEADEIAYALYTLPPRQRRAIARWFGLLEEPEQTLQAQADHEGRSRERIRQRIDVGLRKLRKWSRYSDGDFRVIDMLDSLPRELAAWRDGRDGMRTWAAHQQRRELQPPWGLLSSPLPVRELLAAVDALLAELDVTSRVTASDPEFTTWQEDGVTWGLRVELLRFGHAFQLHEGGERIVLRTWAEVSGLTGAARLVLAGPVGALTAFAVEEGPAGAIDAAWRAVCGPASTPAPGLTWRSGVCAPSSHGTSPPYSGP